MCYLVLRKVAEEGEWVLGVMHPAKSFSLQPKQVRFGIIHTSLVLMEFKMFPFFTGKRFEKNTKYSEKNN